MIDGMLDELRHEIEGLRDETHWLKKENLEFRTFLWKNHGHDSIKTGMWCNQCGIDYEHASLKTITDVWQKVMKPEQTRETMGSEKEETF